MTSLLLWILLFTLAVGLAWYPCSGCCGADCMIYGDDFSTDNLTADYTQVSGSWSVGSGILTTTSANAVLVVDTAHPDTVAEHYLSVSATATTAGDQVRAIVAYTDSNNYLSVELEFASSGSGYLRLYNMSLGSESQIGDTVTVAGAVINNYFMIQACYYNGVLAARIHATGISTTYYEQSVSASGTQVGLGTGSLTGTAKFDDLDYQKHDDGTNSCPVCIDCSTIFTDLCGTDQASKYYKIVIASLANDICSDCGNFNGTYIVGNHGSGWTLTGDFGMCGTDPDSITITFSAPISDFRIEVRLFYGSGGSDYTIWYKEYPSGAPDCTSLSSESLPWSTDLPLPIPGLRQCDGSSSTCAVTALCS